MARKTQKQQAWQERRCDLYRLLPGASPQCAACRRRRHQLARLYSFCTKKQLQLCASTLFVRFQYLRPGARTLPRASDHPQELLEKLEFRFLDFCSFPWPWPWPFIFGISCEFQYKFRIMTFDPQTQCLNDQEQHAWFPLSICRLVSRKQKSRYLSHIYWKHNWVLCYFVYSICRLLWNRCLLESVG